MEIGTSEAEPIWTAFLRKLTGRGLRAVQRARYMTLETISQMSDDPLVSLPAVAS